MTKESYLKRLFNDPRVERYQRRRTRRLLVLTLLSQFTVLLLLARYWPRWYVLAPLLLSLIPVMAMVNMSVRGMTELLSSEMDERMVSMRNKVYRQIYPVAILLTAALVHFAAPFVTPGIWSAATYGGVTGGLLAGLPAMTLAWRLPDEAPEED